MLALAATFLLASATPATPESNVVRSEHAGVRLVAGAREIRAGESVDVAIRIEADSGWHTYWKNPGDSGLATRVAWTLPKGFEAGPIAWPAPMRFTTDTLASYGYEGEVWLLVRVRAPESLRGAKATLAARVDWLECSDVCLPGRADLALVLPIAKGKAANAGGTEQPELTRARARLPLPLPAGASASIAMIGPGPSKARLVVLRATPLLSGGVLFFPDQQGLVEPSEDQPSTRALDRIQLDLSLAPGATLPATGLTGVLVAGDEAWQLTLTETPNP